MSVTSCIERTEDEATARADGSRDYVRVFDLLTDDAADNAHTVGSSGSLPVLYMPHPSNLNALCLEITPRRVDATIWAVTCRYSTKIPKEVAQRLSDPQGGTNSPSQASDPNPLNRPTRWVARTVKYQEAVEKDIYGGRLRNSAGEPFDPPPTRQRARLKLHCVRNKANFNVLQMADYVGAVNSKTFLGFGPRELYLDDIGAEQNFENGYRFVTVEFDLIVNRRGWFLEPLDAGYSELISDKLRPIHIHGQRPQRPMPLNGGGLKLAAGGTPVYGPPRYVYEELDFANLGIF